MSLLVITAYDRKLEELAEHTVPLMKKFCSKYGAKFKEYRVSKIQYEGPWIKIPAILDSLKSGYEFVLWLDVDVVVARWGNSILKEARRGCDLFMCWHEFEKGLLPAHYNAGVMLIRNTRWSREFFQQTLDTGQLSSLRHNWGDQATILHLLGYDNIIGYSSDLEDATCPHRQKVGKLDWVWNSIVQHASAADPVFRHYAGMDWGFRLELVKYDISVLGGSNASKRAARESHTALLNKLRFLREGNRSMLEENEILKNQVNALQVQNAQLADTPKSWIDWFSRAGWKSSLPSRAEEVALCYRVVLGRMPENPDVLNHWAKSGLSLEQMLRAFMNSEEFLSKTASASLAPFYRSPVQTVDTDPSPEVIPPKSGGLPNHDAFT